MLYLSATAYYDNKNNFRLKEIYISDEHDMYVLKKEDSFVPYRYKGNVKNFYDSVKNLFYPFLYTSKVRSYEDDDPKSMAQFFYDKISSTDMKKQGAEKALFDVLSSFGEELE